MIDPERLARAFYEISRRRPALSALLPEWDSLSEELREGAISDGVELVAEYERLAAKERRVWFGPGDERRCTCGGAIGSIIHADDCPATQPAPDWGHSELTNQ